MLRKFIKKNYRVPRDRFSLEVITKDRTYQRFGIFVKTHIWRATRRLSEWRYRLSKAIENQNTVEYNQVLVTLYNLGLLENINLTVLDVFNNLTLENYFSRSLKYLVSQRANVSINTASQLVTHRRVRINNQVITLPYLIITRVNEANISIDLPINSP